MHAASPLSAARRRLVWLLWLALLLPFAQLSATRHALSHAVLQPPAQTERHDAVHTTIACDLCLLAAALGTGAPLAQVAPLRVSTARHALRSAPSPRPAPAAPLPAYESRAPPPTWL